MTDVDERIELGALALDARAYRATFAGRPLRLSPSQFEVLAVLVRCADRVVSRTELATAGGLDHGRSVDVVLTMIRRELGQRSIRNVRNRGWIIEPRAFGT
jgi:DNA-binding response OmpR family regulator